MAEMGQVVEKSMWYEDFKTEQIEKNNVEALKIIEMIENIEGNENAENVKQLKIAINKCQCTEAVKSKLRRKLRLFQNRVERSISDNFGSLIKFLREKNDFSLKQLEESTGISASYINRMEKGERKTPSYPIIEKLAHALEVDIAELLNVANMSVDTRIAGIEKLLLSQNYTINNKVASKKQKEALVELIGRINTLEWNNKTKHLESLEIMNLVNEYKESIK